MISGNLIKIGEDFQFTEKLKEYTINPVWIEQYSSLWSVISGATESVGQTFYHHISRYVENIRDVENCNLHELYSIAKELNVEHIFSYDLAYPPDLEELMNTLSINRSWVLTSGYVLTNPTLKTIYSDLGIGITGGVSGELSAQIIFDQDYISGLIEPTLKTHLTQYSSYSLTGPYSGVALEYQGFMDDIYSNPQLDWNSTVSGVPASGLIIDECTHTLRNIAIRASYQRETLKTIAQKHAMIGTNKGLEKIISEYLLRSYTKKSDWRLYVEPSGTVKSVNINNAYILEQNLPRISDINERFKVDVIEYYDTTEYLNISAASPFLCGIVGYTSAAITSSWIDISGNLCSMVTINPTGTTIWDNTGLCGYVITGGNTRFWEKPDLYDAIAVSEHTSAEVSAFYKNIGLTGASLSAYWDMNKYLWNINAVSGLRRFADIPELTGEISGAYKDWPLSAIPASGWITPPTSLSDMHFKYIGTLSGNVPPANIKNQIYPTMAPQPFLWNLVEKVYEDFPDIIRTLLFSEQSASSQLSSQIDASGNLIDSWKYFNHEYVGYQTAYEEYNNLDYNDKMNKDIDRDGPFHVDALSAYIQNKDMTPFYSQISKEFALSGLTTKITNQLATFKSDILDLSGKTIYEYSFDQNENHYMLYKDDQKMVTKGRIFMRYRNHPMPFPLSDGNSANYQLQQLYCRGDGLYNMGSMVNGNTYDFGFYGNVGWLLGQDNLGNDRLILYTADNIYFNPPIAEELYSVVVDNSIIVHQVDIGSINNYVGNYLNDNFIVFVYVTNRIVDPITGKMTVQLRFQHYDRYTYDFDSTYSKTLTIGPLPTIEYTPEDGDNVWRLVASEELVTIAYEGINTHGGDYINSIVTIDILKNILSDNPNEIAIMEFYNYYDNI